MQSSNSSYDRPDYDDIVKFVVELGRLDYEEVRIALRKRFRYFDEVQRRGRLIRLYQDEEDMALVILDDHRIVARRLKLGLQPFDPVWE